MGAGKTQAIVQYFNTHTEKRFIYISPYLAEAERIAKACPALDFVEPERKYRPVSRVDGLDAEDKSWGYCTKYRDFLEHLRAGRNIVSSHSLFKHCTSEANELVRQHGYELIIDEALDTFEMDKMKGEDFDLLIKSGYIHVDEERVISLTEEGSRCLQKSSFSDFWKKMQLNRAYCLRDCRGKDPGKIYSLWTLREDTLQSFAEVKIFTYLFRYQDLYYYFRMNDIPYEYFGIDAREDGSYVFTDAPTYVPGYVYELGQKIHLIENDRINQIGDEETALSKGWYQSPKRSDCKQLNNNLRTFFQNRQKTGMEQRLWTTFKPYVNSVGGRYKNRWIPCNKKASNEYKSCNTAAYLVNVFPHASKMNYFRRVGLDYDKDGYALSTIVQWVWRTAIRDGEEIYLYVPSRRMRELLKTWIEQVSRGENVQYAIDLRKELHTVETT